MSQSDLSGRREVLLRVSLVRDLDFAVQAFVLEVASLHSAEHAAMDRVGTPIQREADSSSRERSAR